MTTLRRLGYVDHPRNKDMVLYVLQDGLWYVIPWPEYEKRNGSLRDIPRRQQPVTPPEEHMARLQIALLLTAGTPIFALQVYRWESKTGVDDVIEVYPPLSEEELSVVSQCETQ